MAPCHTQFRRLLLASIVFASPLLAGLFPMPASAAGCDRVAAPSGSDSARGRASAPFRTPQKLADSLSAGQTGCLRGGTYSSTSRLNFSHGGRPGAPITLASYPGERAKIANGIVHVTAPYVGLRNLDIDGSANPDVTIWVEGTGAVIEGDSIGNDNAGMSCLFISNQATVTVRRSRFHDCGSYAHGNQDHAIYASGTVGTTITDNLFWDTAGWAIHLYPDAQRTLVAHNVIDGNGGGVIFAGDSSHNTVERNIISNSTNAYLVQSSWDGPVGTGNVARANCLWHGNLGDIAPQVGFTATANRIADPLYLDRSSHDYRLSPSSPCRTVVGHDTAFGPWRLRVTVRRLGRRTPRGRRVVLQARFPAAVSGARAGLQVRERAGWRSVARVRVPSRGEVRVRLRLRRLPAGRLHIRALVRGLMPSRSAAVRLRR